MEIIPHGLKSKVKHDLLFPTDVVAILFGLLIFVHTIFLLSRGLLGDPDTYWHIATGQWMLAEKAFPRLEIFSHTALGKPWINMQWLAQILLALSYDGFGWRGLVVLCGLVISVTFFLLYMFLARNLRATVALGASAVSLVFASNHFLARPHLLTMPIIVVWTACLAHASEENRRPSLWLILMMVLWANLHGGFTLGLLLAGGFGIEAVLEAPSADRRRVFAQWLGFWVGALLAGCITPYGYQYLLLTYDVLNLDRILREVGELRPTNPYTDFNQVVILLCLLALALIFGVRLALVRTLMIVGLLYMALQHVRGLAIFALVLPLLVARPLRRQFAFLQPSTDPYPLFDACRWRPWPIAITLTATVAAVGLFATAYALARPAEAPSDRITPVAAVDHAIRANVTGRVLNAFDFGGYLIFRGVPTFIDGRTLPFGRAFALDYFDATTLAGGDELERLADRYKVSWTLFPPGSAAAQHFDCSSRWRRIYGDKVAVVHVRR